MESTANLMIFCGICRKFDKFHGKQQNAMANLETGYIPVMYYDSVHLDHTQKKQLDDYIVRPAWSSVCPLIWGYIFKMFIWGII